MESSSCQVMRIAPFGDAAAYWPGVMLVKEKSDSVCMCMAKCKQVTLHVLRINDAERIVNEKLKNMHKEY